MTRPSFSASTTTTFSFPRKANGSSLPTFSASSTTRRASPTVNGYAAPITDQSWQPRMAASGAHGRTRSFSEVIKSGRKRAQSVTATEVVETLKAPISYKLVVLCIIWYLASALSNTSSKSILNATSRPVTLTIVQFGFVASWCVALAMVARFVPVVGRAIPGLKGGLRYPNRQVITTTAPLAFFQVGGHIASSMATNKIPVSLVHTIKGMSPLFTVAAYRFLFQIHYSTATYLSLIPLTLGVMLACSVEFRGNFYGVINAFIGALIFVSQNIFSKKLFNESSTASDPSIPLHRRKLDKLNLLCYSSGQAFLLTIPLWLYYEGTALLGEYHNTGTIVLSEKAVKYGQVPLTGWGLITEFLFNGTVHFGQNIIAFVLLSMVTPVTYSVASLIKRIFVILMAIAWFRNSTTGLQACGIGLTFFGLYLYDRAGDTNRQDKALRTQQMKSIEPLLPLNTTNIGRGANNFTETPTSMIIKSPLDTVDEISTAVMSATGGWLPPGRQDEMWRAQ